MALENPAFNNPAFQPPQANGSVAQAPSTYPSMTPPPASTVTAAQAAQAAQNAALHAQLEGAYAAPAAGSTDTGRMTVEDSIHKTIVLFGIMLAFAAVGWVWTLGGLDTANAAAGNVSMAPWLLGMFGTLGLGLVISFTSRTKVRPGLIFGFAALEGLFVGGISAFFQVVWPGVVMQAVLGTFIVVGVTLALFSSGKVRTSPKMTKIFMIAAVSYLIFGLVNLVLVWTGVLPQFGVYSQTFFGIPLGLVIGAVAILMACYSLVMDFELIKNGSANGAPREYGWLAAHGILVSVVWIYVELLRLLAILQNNNN